MRVRVEKGAHGDVADIAEFYDDQETGVGAYFARQFIAKAIELQDTGGTHGKRQTFHFCLVDRFPVGIYYKIQEDEVRVHAVTHCRRSPRWIRQQLKNR